jgi:uncharacterized protein
MSEQDRYIPGVPCWVDTPQPDPDAAAAFYRDLFGWEVQNMMPPGSPGKYYIARIRGGDVGAISSQPPEASGPAVWNTYVWVTNADETAEKVRAAGGRVLVDPFDVPEAGRMAGFADREGAMFFVWQAREHRGATVVNEHGSVNFNDLYVRDLDGARAFYGAVFGWETLGGMGGGFPWALRGYGDFLEAGRPGMRAGMKEMGAPDRFEDVVATVRQIPDDQPDMQPHWGVTFAVDDADAIAARAAELGGAVVVAPFDAPWVRITVIADPQGATFNASKFVPENKNLSQGSGAATA